MAESLINRRLAAILAADVVGYSRLMHRDEAGTLALLKTRRRDVLEPLVARHKGRIFKIAGDGVLVEFASAVNAALCAIELQREMAVANGGAGEDRRIVLRIGINLGDVIVEGADLYGDGINVAARLEELADAGGIVVSGATYDQIKNKIGKNFEDLGSRTLKNIAESVRLYRLVGSSAPAAAGATTDKPAIAVLPFANMSGSAAQDCFCDGLTDSIITGLSRFRDIFVIASNSSFAYKGKHIKVQDASRELGAGYILEGSVQQASGRVRITAQLVDGATGRHLWAERYDRAIEDIFSVQDEVTEIIVGTIATSHGGRLRKAWQNRAAAPGTKDVQALDCFLRGMEALNRYTREDNQQARALFEKAAAIDSHFAKPLAKLSWTYLIEASFGWVRNPEESWTKAFDFAKRAIACDDDEAYGHYSLAGYHMCRRQLDHAISEFEIALALNPNDADILDDLALCFSFSGQPEKGLELARKAMRLNPHHPEYYVMQLGQILFDCRKYDEAVTALESLRNFDTTLMRVYLAAGLAALGRIPEARSSIDRLLELDPDATVARWASYDMLPYRNPEDLEHCRQHLAKAGLPE